MYGMSSFFQKLKPIRLTGEKHVVRPGQFIKRSIFWVIGFSYPTAGLHALAHNIRRRKQAENAPTYAQTQDESVSNPRGREPS